MRRRHRSGSPYEQRYGFSRAVRVGDRIVVAGTAPIGADDADAFGQAERCLRIIVEAIEALGGTAADVVRTRMFVTDPVGDCDEVGRAHAAAFGEAAPAATMVGVPQLIDPRWKVEIEAEAVVSGDPDR